MKPKASELKNWLLIFSLPCLDDILDKTALEHYILLVKCAYTLLKAEISKQELEECEIDLLKFVCHYEMLHGEEKMTFNVHALLHAVQSIRKIGPTSMNSAFACESFIYILKQFISGPNGMDKQIARKHLQSLIFKTGNAQIFLNSEETIIYCKDLFMPKRLLIFNKENGDNVTYVGRGFPEVIEEFMEEGLVYTKCIFENVDYYSVFYSRANKTDDTIVELLTGEFWRILKIVDLNGNCYFHLSLFKVFDIEPFNGISHIKRIKNEGLKKGTISIQNVICKFILVSVKNGRYLCKLPQTFEIQ